MKKYIGTKLVEAEPLNRTVTEKGNVKLEAGYKVLYQDGYESWSPKEVFERAYLPVDDNKVFPSGVSIGPEMVDDFIALTETYTLGDRTTVVRCVLRNGFEIVESSSCMDPKNYSKEMGHNICMEKIKDKIWELLGFLLQTAWNGIK